MTTDPTANDWPAEPDWRQRYLDVLEFNARLRTVQDRKLRQLRQDKSRLAGQVADLTEQVRKLTPTRETQRAEQEREALVESLRAQYRALSDQNNELRRTLGRGQRAAIEKVIASLSAQLRTLSGPAEEIPEPVPTGATQTN